MAVRGGGCSRDRKKCRGGAVRVFVILCVAPPPLLTPTPTLPPVEVATIFFVFFLYITSHVAQVANAASEGVCTTLVVGFGSTKDGNSVQKNNKTQLCRCTKEPLPPLTPPPLFFPRYSVSSFQLNFQTVKYRPEATGRQKSPTWANVTIKAHLNTLCR